MNPDTGEVRKFATMADASAAGFKVPLNRELSQRVVRFTSNRRRRGWMRNQPCPCGSGKKFKRCHWERCDELNQLPQRDDGMEE